MSVRAKFKVSKIEQTMGYVRTGAIDEKGQAIYAQKPVDTVVLNAISDEANKTWSQYTPCGQLSLTMNNPDATGQFKLDKCYFLDFTEAPAAEADEKK